MAAMGKGRGCGNECHFGPGQLEVPVMLSQAVATWVRSSGLKLETPQACITTCKPTAGPLFRAQFQNHFFLPTFSWENCRNTTF